MKVSAFASQSAVVLAAAILFCVVPTSFAASNSVQNDQSSTQQTIFVYGDSNTFGWVYEPKTKIVSRLPLEKTWPYQMGKVLGDKYHIEVDALGGRTTDLDEPISTGSGEIPGITYNGLTTLPAALSANMPVDLVIIMLGTNDLKAGHHREAQDVAQGLANLTRCVINARWQSRTDYKAPRVLIVLPPPMDGDHTPYGDFFAGSLAKTKVWGPIIEKAVTAAGVQFFDGGAVVGLPDQPDNVHLTSEEHELLGKAVAQKVREMMHR